MKSKLVLTVLACVLSPALISVIGCGSEADPPATPATGGGGTTSVGGGGTTSVAGGGTTSVAGGGTTGGGGSVSTAVCDAPTMVFQVDNDANPGQGCSGSICHIAANVAMYPPDLVSPGVAARVKDVTSTTMGCSGNKYIDSANVENSLLLKKLTAAPGCGSPMPFPVGGLAQDKIDCIRSWVTSIATTP